MHKNTVTGIRDQLILCLTGAIHAGVSAQRGSNWFSAFAQEEAAQEQGKRIVQNGQTAIFQCDLQACLKLLRYRPVYRTMVLERFGFFHPQDPQSNYAKTKQLEALLDRLIGDYRNAMDAHSRACDIQREIHGQGAATLYSRQDAVTDMLKLGEIFSAVTDASGVSYYRRMCTLRDNWLKASALTSYRVVEALERENLPTDKAGFLECCESLGIGVVTLGGELCFSTADYSGDMKKIRDRLELLAKASKKRPLWPWILVAVLFLAVVVLLTVLLVGKPEADAEPSRTGKTTPSTTASTPTTTASVPTTTGAEEENVFFNEDNYVGEPGKLSVRPYHVYWQDGMLIAECFVINNLDHRVYNIDVENITIQNRQVQICQGSFGRLEGLRLEAGSYTRWTFRFLPDAVITENARLDYLGLGYSLKFQP